MLAERREGPETRDRFSAGLLAALPYLMAAAALVSWKVSLSSIHPYQAKAIGLVSQLTVLWWLGLAIAAAAIVLELRRDAPRTLAMVVLLAAFALILHGTLPATETVPRFSTAYYVAGFSEYLGRTGQALPRLDVRMSWPAMFAAAGMAARAMGVSTLWFLRWCPFILNLAYLFPIKAIANTCLHTPRARWAALAIFLAGNWIDQDYFSPQGVNLFLFLAAVAIVIRVFSSGGYLPRIVEWFVATPVWDRLTRVSARTLQLPFGATTYEVPESRPTTRHRLAMLTVLLVLVGASAVTHQITPAALCLVFFVFMLTGRTGLRMLWLLMAVMVWAWLSWEGHTYWSNHLSKVFGSAGQVGSTLNSTVGARLQGATLGRSLVQYGRLLAAALTWLGALAGFWVLWRRGRTMWTMAIVAAAPIAVAGAVSYGGEVALRVLLFSLAPAAVLIASLIDRVPLVRSSVAICLAVAVALLVLFPLDRYGNESFEAIAPGDLAAAVWIHGHVPNGAVVYVANRDEPLYYAHVGVYRLLEVGNLINLKSGQLSERLPVSRVPTYIYLTSSETNYGVDFQGNPSNWISTFVDELLKTGDVHVVYRTPTALVLQVKKSAPPRHPAPIIRPHQHPTVTPTTRPKPPPPKPKPAPTTRPKPPPTTRPKPTTTTRPKSTTTTRPITTTTQPGTTTTTYLGGGV